MENLNNQLKRRHINNILKWLIIFIYPFSILDKQKIERHDIKQTNNFYKILLRILIYLIAFVFWYSVFYGLNQQKLFWYLLAYVVAFSGMDKVLGMLFDLVLFNKRDYRYILFYLVLIIAPLLLPLFFNPKYNFLLSLLGVFVFASLHNLYTKTLVYLSVKLDK